MKSTQVHVIAGLLACLCAACASAIGFSACVDNADNCYNTATCPFPSYCYEAGDAVDEVDGCFGFGGGEDAQAD